MVNSSAIRTMTTISSISVNPSTRRWAGGEDELGRSLSPLPLGRGVGGEDELGRSLSPLPLGRGVGGEDELGRSLSPLPLGRGVGGEGPSLSFLPNICRSPF